MYRNTTVHAIFQALLFVMDGYSNICRLDRNDKGGAIMLFVKDSQIIFPTNMFCSQKSSKFSSLH